MKHNCDNVITLKQYGPTCWFTSILMGVLYSDGSRKLLLKKSKTWSNKILLFKTLKYILENKYLRSSNIYKDYEYFDKIRPEYILEKLYKYNKKKFSFNPKINKGGYSSHLYIRKIYKLLGVKVLFLDLKDDLLYYSKYNNTFVDNSVVRKDYKINIQIKIVSKEKVLEKFENPDVIIVNCTSNITKNLPDYYKVPTNSPFYKIASLNDEVNIKEMKYVQDSVLLSNWNVTGIGGHSISGIKCKGDKYVYNGWTRSTIDIHLQTANLTNFTKEDYDNARLWVAQVIRKKIVYINIKNNIAVYELPDDGILVSDNINIPCELMKFDWDVHKNSEFCINKKKCVLDTHTDKSIGEIIANNKNELCFSFNKGPRNIIYVNETMINDNKSSKENNKCAKGKVLNPLTNKCKNIDSINNLPKKSLNKMDKKCPEGKVINPKTGRCIKKENLMKMINPAGPVVKECPEGKVRNPKTGRCIKKENLMKMINPVGPAVKECPEGKVRNPKTGRCIKKENLMKMMKIMRMMNVSKSLSK